MEFVKHDDGTCTPIPDAVVAASDNRDLVVEYVAASPADREHIHELAIEATSPTEEPSASAAPAPATALPLSDTAAPEQFSASVEG